MKPARVAALTLCAVLVAHQPAVRGEPFATAFTFQAQLDQGGSPLNGTADLRFELFGIAKGGTQVGTTVAVSDLAVTSGLVSVRLDFGVDVFDGDDRWLEVSIRSPHDPSDTIPFTTLSPRQPVSPIPYALQTRGIFVDEDGLVTIGAPAEPSLVDGPANPMARMHVRGTPADSLGVLAEVAAMTGDATGVKGTTEDPGGRGIEGIGPGQGVRGEATATGGATHGVAGINCSDVGAGVMGYAADTGGSADGVHGKTESPNGRGVFGEGKSEGVRGETLGNELVSRGVCGVSASQTGEGVVGHASAGMGTTTGVRGMSDSVDGAGVVGQAAMEGVRGESTAPGSRGVCGVNSATAGEGVLGHASAGSGTTTGVRGMSDSPNGTGVVGQAAMEGVRGEATAVGGRGVCGVNASSSGGGVFGHATAASGNTVGVHGMSDSVDGGAGIVGQAVGNGTGVVGNAAMEGVRGEAEAGIGVARGVCGISSSIAGEGVFGHAMAMSGVTHGIHGRSDSPLGIGVFGESTTDGRGVFGKSQGTSGIGVEGRAGAISGMTSGVSGFSNSDLKEAAGVLALGNKVQSPGQPAAAALRIENGAITVGGEYRPAGSITVSASWTQVFGCPSAPIGYFTDVQLVNDLLVSGSIILLTVEVSDPLEADIGYSAHVIAKAGGSADIRVTAIGRHGGPCSPPPAVVSHRLHYLIINPLP